ncbi:MAG: hypothetical protein E6J91_21670 [Deltaproteobacteria bacterium]|nr:MAG: hypothetical protein E6J91_21670 [Deltaproteobacteria bacterium]
MAEPSKDTAPSAQGLYTTWDAFLKQAIREYYDRSWTTRKGNFIALLIAAGQTSFALAKDSVVDGSGTKKVAIGAGLLLALPMVSYFVRNRKSIINKVGAYKAVIADHEKRYLEIQAGWRDGKYQVTDRNLMIDGLMKQFIKQVDDA